MIVQAYFEGAKISTYTSKKDGCENKFATIYFRAIDGDGEPDLEQMALRTYDAATVAKVGTMTKGNVYSFDLRITQASVTSIE